MTMRKTSSPRDHLPIAWDRESIRRLLSAAFDDAELTTFCFERFDPVHQKFSSGLDTGKKIQMLLDYAVRHRQLTTLPGLVRKYNPEQYAH